MVYVVRIYFLYVYLIHSLVMKINKYKNKIKKNPGNQTPCHSSFSGGIICGPHRGSFSVRNHLRFNLGIISGLGIICGAVHFRKQQISGKKYVLTVSHKVTIGLFWGIMSRVFLNFPQKCLRVTAVQLVTTGLLSPTHGQKQLV